MGLPGKASQSMHYCWQPLEERFWLQVDGSQILCDPWLFNYSYDFNIHLGLGVYLKDASAFQCNLQFNQSFRKRRLWLQLYAALQMFVLLSPFQCSSSYTAVLRLPFPFYHRIFLICLHSVCINKAKLKKIHKLGSIVLFYHPYLSSFSLQSKDGHCMLIYKYSSQNKNIVTSNFAAQYIAP